MTDAVHVSITEKFYSLYSGGKDSTAVTDWLNERDQLAGIVTFNTGIATPDWFPFVEKKAREQWGKEIIVLSTLASYDSLVEKYGFPGPGKHGMFMNYLKGRCVRQFKKRFPGAALASGVRKGESKRRFRNTAEWSTFEGVRVWAPLYDWSTEQVWAYLRGKGFERSPAYEVLCISGDCLCGAYATAQERAAIKAFYPDLWLRLDRLEKLTGKQWGWGANRGGRRGSVICVDCESKN